MLTYIGNYYFAFQRVFYVFFQPQTNSSKLRVFLVCIWQMQTSLENDQRKGYETTEKSPKSFKIYRPPETGDTKKPLKIIQNQAKIY
jgi:hypothetical protein